MKLIFDELQKVAKVSFTFDGWTSPSSESFLAVTGHWVDDCWNLQELILGFEKIEGRHTADVLL
jgi:hypothetical protein